MGSVIVTEPQMNQKRLDWHLFWTAGAVIVALGALIVGCFKSLSYDIKQIDQRLSKLEGAFEERGRWESRRERT
jgi:hypothetical protein